jgi:hypothetical protein
VPGLPITGGVPLHPASWWPALLVLPALAGVLVGWTLRRIDDDPAARIRTVLVAGALVGFGCVLLGTVAGGRLGNGVFDPVSIPVGVASVAAFCWITIPGGFVAFFAGPHEPPKPPAELDIDDSEITQELEAIVDDEADEDAAASEEAEADEDTEGDEVTEDAENDEVGEGTASDEAAEAPDEREEVETRDAAETVEESEVDTPAEEPVPAEAEPEAVTECTESAGDDGAAEADR